MRGRRHGSTLGAVESRTRCVSPCSCPRDVGAVHATLLGVYGVLTPHFTPAQVRKDPMRVLALLEKACPERAPGFDRVRVRDDAEPTGSG